MNRVIKSRVWNRGKWITEFYIAGDGAIYDWSGNILIDAVAVQFTGLQDLDGVDIYEGDIIASAWEYQSFRGEFRLGNPGVVSFSECDASVQGSTCEVPIIAFNFGYPLQTDEVYKIIGNIYENPNLIPD